MSAPRLDVIVVSFNTREHVTRCLSSLLATPPRGLADLVLVDNASADGTVDAVRAAWPQVRVIALDRNVGFAAANNVGIRATGAPLVLLLNSDTVVAPGAIDALIDRLDVSGATAIGPRLVDASGRPEVSFGRALSPLSELIQRRRVRLARSGRPAARRTVDRWLSQERWVDWVSGACLLVRRDAAVAAGLLDERYFMYEEDVDFCAALRAQGGRILFTPDVTITHLGGQSARTAVAATREHYDRSHLAYYEKHLPHWAPVLRWWQARR